MESYGDRVQFELPGKGQRPHYQIINPTGRKMGFDSKNLLLRLNEDGNIADTLSSVFSIEAIKAAASGVGKTASRTRVSRVSTGSSVGSGASRQTAATQVVDTVERDKYAYFKENRETMPEGIQKFSQQISELMHSGMAAEDAFNAIIEKHF